MPMLPLTKISNWDFLILNIYCIIRVSCIHGALISFDVRYNMKRTIIREHVFRILFRYDFYDTADFAEQAALYFDTRNSNQEPQAYIKEEDGDALDIAVIQDLDRAEIQSRAEQMAQRIPELDDAISKVCDGWSIGRIGKAELTILRLAAYEIMFDEQIEPAVAINEAVELSKKYCTDKSHSFVNGVLSKLIK